MKKIMISLSVCSLLVGEMSANYTVDSGWSLLGVGENQKAIDVSKLSSNIDFVWKYTNGKWKAYSTNSEINKKIGTTFGIIDKINSGEGFWVNTKSSTTIETESTNVDSVQNAINTILANPKEYGLVKEGTNLISSTGKVLLDDHSSEVDITSKQYQDYTYNYSKGGGLSLLQPINWDNGGSIDKDADIKIVKAGTKSKSKSSKRKLLEKPIASAICSTDSTLCLNLSASCQSSVTISVTPYNNVASMPSLSHMATDGYKPLSKISADIAVRKADKTRLSIPQAAELCSITGSLIYTPNDNTSFNPDLEYKSYLVDGFDTTSSSKVTWTKNGPSYKSNNFLLSLSPFILGEKSKVVTVQRPVKPKLVFDAKDSDIINKTVDFIGVSSNNQYVFLGIDGKIKTYDISDTTTPKFISEIDSGMDEMRRVAISNDGTKMVVIDDNADMNGAGGVLPGAGGAGDPMAGGAGDPVSGGGDPMAGGEDSMSGGEGSLSGGGDPMAGGEDSVSGSEDPMAGGEDSMSGGGLFKTLMKSNSTMGYGAIFNIKDPKKVTKIMDINFENDASGMIIRKIAFTKDDTHLYRYGGSAGFELYKIGTDSISRVVNFGTQDKQSESSSEIMFDFWEDTLILTKDEFFNTGVYLNNPDDLDSITATSSDDSIASVNVTSDYGYNQLEITAGNSSGSASITVTANMNDGTTQSKTFDVSLESDKIDFGLYLEDIIVEPSGEYMIYLPKMENISNMEYTINDESIANYRVEEDDYGINLTISGIKNGTTKLKLTATTYDGNTDTKELTINVEKTDEMFDNVAVDFSSDALFDTGDYNSALYYGTDSLNDINGAAVSSDNNYAYLVQGNKGIVIVDIKTGKELSTIKVGTKTAYYATDVAITSDGKWLYVCADNGGVFSYSLRDPKKPVLVGQYKDIAYAMTIEIAKDMPTAVISFGDGFQVVDISSPAKPKLLGKYENKDSQNGGIIEYIYISPDGKNTYMPMDLKIIEIAK
jgi:hypothetical protein